MNRNRQVSYKRDPDTYNHGRYSQDNHPKSNISQNVSEHMYVSEDSRANSPLFETHLRASGGNSNIIYRGNLKHSTPPPSVYTTPIQAKDKQRENTHQDWNASYNSETENDCHIYRNMPEYYEAKTHHNPDRMRHDDARVNAGLSNTSTSRGAKIDHLSPLPRADIDAIYQDGDWDKSRPVNLDQLLRSPSIKMDRPKIRMKNTKVCMEEMVSDLKEILEAELAVEGDDRRRENISPRVNIENLRGYGDGRKPGGMAHAENVHHLATAQGDNIDQGSLNLKVNLTGQEVLLVVNPTQQATLSIPVRVSISPSETQENDKTSLFADSLINFLFQDCTLESDVRNRIKSRIDEYMNLGGLKNHMS